MMWSEIIAVVPVAFVGLVLYFQSKKETPERIFNVYSRPGKWYYLKYLIFLALLEARKAKRMVLEKYNNEVSTAALIADMERFHPLSDHKRAFDAVFFQGVDMGGYYICGGTEHRHGSKTCGLFYIVVPGIGLLESERLPNTELQTDGFGPSQYCAEGICFTLVEPMKTWKILFNGKMRLQGQEVLIDVKLEAEFHSNNPYFLFERDLHSKPLARATAREKWSVEYFKTLKELHATHYEQMGKIEGSLTVNNEKHELNLWSFRDHSYGERDWALLHRYAFHVIYLCDETKIVIGIISQPSIMSHFESGYVLHRDKSINAISSCDLQLYQHGEDGNPGKNVAFSFVAGQTTYVVNGVKIEYESVHYKGHNNEAKIIERFMKYDVNGIKGKGFADWHYNVGKMTT